MLEKIDLTQKVEKQNYKEMIPGLILKIGDLQRQARELGMPVIIVFEGWDAAGKGTLMNELIISMDPRGFNVYNTVNPNEEERLRPYLWRFWPNTPAKGRIAIFNRSWYSRLHTDRVDKIVKEEQLDGIFKETNSFEKQLADGGTTIIKFFLHISKKEQKKRFKELKENNATSWRVTGEDKKHHKQYNDYKKAYEDMLVNTDNEYAPWVIIEAHDKRFASLKIFKTVIDALENKINRIKKVKTIRAKEKSYKVSDKIETILDKVDLTNSLTEPEYEEKLKKYQEKIRNIEYELYSRRLPLAILYEGWDAAGKGGNIRRMTQNLDPRGYEVIPVSAPNDIEKSHHYLWRFWRALPKAGHITIFDRTWYGRVLVERVEGFCSENDWKRAFKEINDMEEQFVGFGMILVKFWLQIDRDEQLKRFEERQSNPDKQWKITEEDWRNREKWDRYEEAVNEMLLRTSTAYAPWTIVESNSKYFARIKTLKTVVEIAESKLKDLK